MRRRLCLLLMVVGAAFLAGPAHAAGPTIYITNLSTVVTDAEVLDALPAFQTAIDRDFYPAWNASAQLQLTDASPPGSWSIELRDYPECWFCAGYHDILGGMPHAQVGMGGEPPYDWAITFTHEVFEMLADPFINRGMLISPRPGAKERWYALETADPVEADALAYTVPSASGKPIHISDFVLESWFRRGSRGPWDFTHATSRPLQILDEGYQLVWTGRAWADLSRSKTPRV